MPRMIDDSVALLGYGRFGRALGQLLAEAGIEHRAYDEHADVPPEHRAASIRELTEGAAFVIVAGYPRWKEVIRKLLDPTKGMMQNKLKLTKGHMPTMVKFVTASKELVESTSRVPTQFLDE